MDIKDIVAKFGESPAAYRKRLNEALTDGYTSEWSIKNQYRENYIAKIRRHKQWN